MHQLTIKQDSNLLNVVVRQDITPAQVSIVTAILKVEDLAYGEVLFFLANRNQLKRHAADYDAPVGAGEEVEAFRG